MQNKLSSILLTAIFVSSCGGGGGGGGGDDGYTPPTPPANSSPTFANVGTIAVPENTTTIGTVTATDADGDTLTYSLTGDDASLISIVSSTGALTFNTAPDFENPSSASGDNNYSITVVASDGSATGSVGIVVSVTDVDEDTNSAPTITSSASYSVEENSTAIGTVTAEDSDGDTLTYTVSGTNISIGTSTGVLTFDSAPTYNSDGNNTYQATVQVSDGTATDSQDITVTVTEQSTSTNASDLFISEYAEGSSNNKYLEIFNATGSSVNLNDYAIRSKVNGNNVYYNDYFEPNVTLEDKALYVICHPQADQIILDKCNVTNQYLSNGDDTYQLGKGDESNFEVIDTIGDFGDDPGDGWDVCGVTEGTKEHTLIKKDGKEGTDNWELSAGTSSDDCSWLVKDQNDWDNLGVHTWNGAEAGGGSGGGGSGGGGSGGGGSGGGGTTTPSTELYLSEYADVEASNETTTPYGNTKYIEIYNPNSEAVDLSAYTLKGIANSQPDSWGSGQTADGRVLELTGTLAAKDVYLITGVDSSYGDIDDYVVSQADLRLDYESPVHFNGDDAVGLFKGDILLDSVGTDGPTDIGIGWEVCGVENATRRNTLIKKADKSGESDWSVSAGTNADNCHWVVRNEGDFTNAGFHNQEVKNVSVPNGISGGFTIDGQSKPTLTLERGKIYRFDTSSSTMSSHPIHFGNTAEESSSTTIYGTQVGALGTTGSHYLLEVTDSINNIYYFCGSHTGMGGSVSITNDSNTAPELVVPAEVYTLPSNYVYVDEGTKSVADFSANDAEGDSLSYFVTGEDESSFGISSSGALAFVNTPSYNSKKEYSITVNVSDGLSSDSLILSVYVDRLCTDSLIGFNVCLEGESTGGVTYDRDNDYDTWKDWDNDCQSNRHEVLIEEHDSSTGVGLTYTSNTNCSVATGRWYDPYDNAYFSSASDVQIDHFVPLSESHRSGAWAWSRERKTIYANTLNVPEQLIAVGGSSNSAKGSSDPSDWMPDNTSYHCTYLRDWVKIKSIYRLGINSSEEDAIRNGFSGCDTETQTETIQVSFAANENGSGNVYVINGVQKKSLTLNVGTKYIFNHSTGHPLSLSTTADGTHGNGSEYVDGVTKSPGVTEINVTSDTPSTLYYYCDLHPGMGSNISVTNS
jgi:hypothetical protein